MTPYERILQTIHRAVCTVKLVGMIVALLWCLLIGSIVMTHCGCEGPHYRAFFDTDGWMTIEPEVVDIDDAERQRVIEEYEQRREEFE